MWFDFISFYITSSFFLSKSLLSRKKKIDAASLNKKSFKHLKVIKEDVFKTEKTEIKQKKSNLVWLTECFVMYLSRKMYIFKDRLKMSVIDFSKYNKVFMQADNLGQWFSFVNKSWV